MTITTKQEYREVEARAAKWRKMADTATNDADRTEAKEVMQMLQRAMREAREGGLLGQ